MARTPWQVQLALTAAIWGSSFFFIKVAVEELPPLWVAFGRCALGALALAAILVVRRERLPRDPRLWRHLAVTAFLLNGLAFVLFAYGETKASSVLAGIWNATTPLMVLVVVLLAFPEEQPTRERLVGLLVGFVGVVVVLSPWSGLGGQALIGQLAFIGASVLYGFGYPYTRRHLSSRPEGVVPLMTAQILCGAVLLGLTLPFSEPPDPGAVSVAAIASMLCLGALGTGVAYILNFNVVRAAGASTAATVTYLVPIVSTALGVLVLGEQLRWHEPVGAVIVLAGVAISARRVRTSR